MYKVMDKLWVGNSGDEAKSVHYVRLDLVDRVLIVAHDMKPVNGWEDGVEYAQVGLVDGPGNPLAAYHAAVLALVTLARKGRVLVCCHDGGRSLAVAIMYLYLMGDGPSWDEAVARTAESNIEVNDAHKRAFFLMDWAMLDRVIKAEV